jgi:signal transduction histidine kinase/ActR/RegA family two-component response regulator
VRGIAPPLKSDVEFSPQRRVAELMNANESLRDEIDRLRQEHDELVRRLAESQVSRQTDRQARRAALNLMEDAITARAAEQRENAERRRVEAELREADRRKDEFLAMLAHELRNPLAPIRNSVQILRMNGADANAADHVCETLDRQVNHMVRLVDDLMEVSRITRGKIALQVERVELSTVVRNAIEISSPLIEAASHQLELRLPDEPIYVDGDAVRLTQVFANLLNNATKFTPNGGQLWLVAKQEGAEAVVTLRDNGIGIAAEMLPRVFDLFTQASGGHNRSSGGLGIGLTLVQRLVELHNGQISVSSDGVGLGTEFVVRLPIAQKKAAADEGRSPVSRPTRIASRRVMVVDDNQDAAKSLAMLLRCLGSEVTVAHDGRTALREMENLRPSIMFLDIGMPEMDGNEVARRVRLDSGGQDVILVALTGWGQEEDRRRSKEAGFDHHLVKPVDLQTLQAILKSPAEQLPRSAHT